MAKPQLGERMAIPLCASDVTISLGDVVGFEGEGLAVSEVQGDLGKRGAAKQVDILTGVGEEAYFAEGVPG